MATDGNWALNDVAVGGAASSVTRSIRFPNTGMGRFAELVATAEPDRGGSNPALISGWSPTPVGRDDPPPRSIFSPGRPVAIRIDAIAVAAAIDAIAIVDGVMQDPATAVRVAWYQETGRLGEAGNVVLAGHFDDWGVPEGVFHRLARLNVGDEVVVSAADGRRHRYAVGWTRLAERADADAARLVSPTATPSLTLITCGGPWDASRRTYRSRTVVRATLASAAD